MKTKVVLLIVLAACVALLAATAEPATIYHLVGIHNADTLNKVQKDYLATRKPTADAVAQTAKSGDALVDAAKEASANTDEKTLSQLDNSTSTYEANVEKARRQREAYAAKLDALKEEIQYASERWNDIVQKMGSETMKQEHQRKIENRTRNLARKIQQAEKGLQALDLALGRAADVELAVQSIKQDALLGQLGEKLGGFTVEVRQANLEMNRAADSLMASLQFEEVGATS